MNRSVCVFNTILVNIIIKRQLPIIPNILMNSRRESPIKSSIKVIEQSCCNVSGFGGGLQQYAHWTCTKHVGK
jgi:hypothetical protein